MSLHRPRIVALVALVALPAVAALAALVAACGHGETGAGQGGQAGQAGQAGQGGQGGGGGAGPASIASPPEADDLDPDPQVVRVKLRADRTTHTIGGKSIDGYAFNGSTPGPTIRARVGDTVSVELDNALGEPTTLHWHGVHVPNAMDGVTWMADPVPAGSTFTYSFVVDRPGTFWYHPHLDEHRQVDLGLYGALVVEAPSEPRSDELVLVLDAWDEKQEAGGDEHGAHGAGSLPTLWTVNGALSGEARLKGGSAVRVRVLNASITGYASLSWPGLRQIGSDQGLLPQAASPERVLLGPGDRIEAEWSVGREGFDVTMRPYSLAGGEAVGDETTLMHVSVDAPADPPPPLALPFPGGSTTPDPSTTDIVYVFSGSDEGGGWLINGEAFPDVTVHELPLGSEAIVEVRNLSSAEHPFHLHGMPFEVLSVDGAPPPYRTVEDTFNVKIRQSVRLRVVADNPGDWMAHCHILPHAHGGMMTVVRVKLSALQLRAVAQQTGPGARQASEAYFGRPQGAERRAWDWMRSECVKLTSSWCRGRTWATAGRCRRAGG